MSTRPGILVFGGGGAIGSAVRGRFAALGWRVSATSRTDRPAAAGDDTRWIRCEAGDLAQASEALRRGRPYAAVCWAQGVNISDSVLAFDAQRHLEVYRSNCLFVLDTLGILLEEGLLAERARLVVVSSIWQHIARQNKLSYIMSKAALGGLVQSASVDLAARGFTINAVLPSALDTAMTAASLSRAQIAAIAGGTGFNRLVALDEVVAAVEFLCSARSAGITGQSLTVDLGFSHARLV